MAKRGGHAVVLGASMSGLLAARVLADRYERVTVVERDLLPHGPHHSRGAPRGRQIHTCSARVGQILDELFPGLGDDLVTAGVTSRDDGDFSRLEVSFGGHRLVRSGSSPDSLRILSPCRPLLEWSVRQRLQSIANVTFREGHEVVGLVATPDRRRIIGVRVVDRAYDRASTLTANLVVDATGRESRTPLFLEQLRYGRPREDEMALQLAYAWQLVRLAPESIAEHTIVKLPEPGRPRMFALLEYEGGTSMVCAATTADMDPPRNHHEIVSYATELADHRVVTALRTAEPLGDVAHHRVPSNRWRRYDKMRRLPVGLLILGDAVCSFNPIYGQGMTIAAVEATLLRDCLRGREVDLTKRFTRLAAKKVRSAWRTALAADSALSEVPGPRPLSSRIANACREPVARAAETDPVVARQLLRVVWMVDAPIRLLRPSMLLRVLRVQHRRTGTESADDESEGSLIAATSLAI